MQTKNKIRDEIRAALSRVDDGQNMAKSSAIAQKVFALDEYRDAKTVMLYLPFAPEVHTGEIASHAIAAGKRICAPTSPHDRIMKIVEILPPLDGHFDAAHGLRSPLGREIAVEEIDMVIVPALAYDRNCGRLGRGGGYYDRFLAREELRAFLAVVAFCEQLRDNIPIEPQDKSVDMVITDTDIFRK